MNHRMWLAVAFTLTGLFGLIATLALAVAISLNLVGALVVAAIAMMGMRVMGQIAAIELQAIKAHQSGLWCSHTHCAKHRPPNLPHPL